MVLTSAFFGVVHYPVQGVPGVQQAFVVGMLVGTLYAATRQLWLPMILHAVFDLTALYLIYNGLERDVAGWFFR